jgi:large subunit ribosomal protein L17
MRHRKAGRQLRRTSEQRLALLRNLAISLIEHGAIETTEAKAKELRPFVERLITKAKRGTLHDRRLAVRHVHVRRAADTLFQSVGPAFATRTGGYTRILKVGHRKGDGAEMARIEMIGVGGGDGPVRAPKKTPPPKKAPRTPRAKTTAPGTSAGSTKGRTKTPAPVTKQTRKAGDKGGSKG